MNITKPAHGPTNLTLVERASACSCHSSASPKFSSAPAHMRSKLKAALTHPLSSHWHSRTRSGLGAAQYSLTNVLKVTHSSHMFVLIFLEHVFPPKGWQQELFQIVKFPKCLDLIGCTLVLPISEAHLRPRPVSKIPETGKHGLGSLGRKTGFTDTGPENRVWVLLNYSSPIWHPIVVLKSLALMCKQQSVPSP